MSKSLSRFTNQRQAPCWMSDKSCDGCKYPQPTKSCGTSLSLQTLFLVPYVESCSSIFLLILSQFLCVVLLRGTRCTTLLSTRTALPACSSLLKCSRVTGHLCRKSEPGGAGMATPVFQYVLRPKRATQLQILGFLALCLHPGKQLR